LSKGLNAGDSEAAEAIRDLVETVTVFRNPSHPGGLTVEIVGRLNALLGEQAYPHNVRGVWGKVVARERVGQDSRQQIPVFPATIDLGIWRQSSFAT
jgi:site-specific DNA recombinase